MILATITYSRSATCRMATSIKFLLLAAICLTTHGCARKYWRKQADELSYNLIRDKQSDPRWVVDRVQVETDPRSRFFEAFDPDFEPLPPDDAAAHEFMHWAYGKRGWKHWHEFGDQSSVDNPHWLEPFGMTTDVVEDNMGRPGRWPEFAMTMEDAIDLSYIHSRDYQTQIENVYLAALALTLQRFAFDVQFVGLNGQGKPSGSLIATDVPNTSDSATFAPVAGVSQLLPTGGQLLVEMANNTLWFFSKGNPSEATASTLSYSLVQPLLANGGRRFVMENLTQSERNMLYAVRDLARYRQGFFTSTVAAGFTAGIQTGVVGVFSGTGPIPTAPPQIAGGAAGGNGGFLGLLQLYQSVANSEYNIRQLSEQLERLRAQATEQPDQFSEPLAALPAGIVFPESLAGRVTYDGNKRQLLLRGSVTDVELRLLLAQSDDPVFRRALTSLADSANMLTTTQSIVQLETQLAQTVNGLRSARVTYLNGLDNFKLFLGLPVDMPVTIDTSMLKPFELVDGRLIRLQDRLNAFVLEPPPIDPLHPDAAAMSRVAALMKRLNAAEPDLEIVRRLVDEMLVIRDDMRRDGVEVTEDDFRRAAIHRQRTAAFEHTDFAIQKRRDPKRDERLNETLLAEFRDSEAQLLKLQKDLAPSDVDEESLKKALENLADLREDFLKISQSFSVVQIDLRVDMIDLNPWNMSMEDAVATGMANRLDLMNSRAAVMDSRRKVEVAANQLQAVVNLVANGNIQTQPIGAGIHNPFDFRGQDSAFQVGVQFTTPIQLVAQRNAYRAALVGYQQSRRNYQRTEDQVKLDIRQRARFLDQTSRNFETTRDQIRSATAQLDITSEQIAAPAAPGAQGGTQQAQGLQIIQAVSSVLAAQNSLIQLWVGYEAFRLDIYNYMGTLEIDREGYWTDEFYQARARIHRANPNRLYPPLPSSLENYCPPDSPAGPTPGESFAGTDIASARQGASGNVKPQASDVPLPKPVSPIRLVGAETLAQPLKMTASQKGASKTLKPATIRNAPATAAGLAQPGVRAPRGRAHLKDSE